MDGSHSEHRVVSHVAAAGRTKEHIVAVLYDRHAYFYAELLPKAFAELLGRFDLHTQV